MAAQINKNSPYGLPGALIGTGNVTTSGQLWPTHPHPTLGTIYSGLSHNDWFNFNAGAPSLGWYWDAVKHCWMPPTTLTTLQQGQGVIMKHPTPDEQYFQHIAQDLAKDNESLRSDLNKMKGRNRALEIEAAKNRKIVEWLLINHPDYAEEFSVWARAIHVMGIGEEEK